MREPMTALDSSPVAGPDAEPPRTTLPVRQPRRSPPQPRPLHLSRLPDVMSVVGAFGAGGASAGLMWTEISPFSGIIGFVVVWWILFVLYYALLVSFDENRMTVRDRLSAVVVQSLAVLVFVIVYTFYAGWSALVHLNFYTQDARFGGPLTPLTESGALQAVVGTLL